MVHGIRTVSQFPQENYTWVARNSAYHQKNVVINFLQCEFRTVLP